MAQAPHIPTQDSRARVKILASRGVPYNLIAALLGISDKTLTKYYSNDLLAGHAAFGEELTGTLYEMAVIQRIPSMVAFALKTRFGYREADKLPPPEAPGPKTKIVRIIGGLPK